MNEILKGVSLIGRKREKENEKEKEFNCISKFELRDL
jgi:hypothetical protein